MEKVEVSVEFLGEVMSEMRKLRVMNMELHSQLSAVERLLAAVKTHMPSEGKVEYIPGVVAELNKILEKAAKPKEEKKQVTKLK